MDCVRYETSWDPGVAKIMLHNVIDDVVLEPICQQNAIQVFFNFFPFFFSFSFSFSFPFPFSFFFLVIFFFLLFFFLSLFIFYFLFSQKPFPPGHPPKPNTQLLRFVPHRHIIDLARKGLMLWLRTEEQVTNMNILTPSGEKNFKKTLNSGFGRDAMSHSPVAEFISSANENVLVSLVDFMSHVVLSPSQWYSDQVFFVFSFLIFFSFIFFTTTKKTLFFSLSFFFFLSFFVTQKITITIKTKIITKPKISTDSNGMLLHPHARNTLKSISSKIKNSN